MRKEYLRVANGTKRNSDTEQLHNFCFTAYEGEIAAIIGSRIHEMECLEALLSGKEDFSSSTMFLKGEKISATGKPRFLRKNLVELATFNELVEQLSIADNVFALRPGIGPFFVKERENYSHLKRILQKFSLNIDPDQSVSSLSQLQKYQLHLLKLYLNGANAILLNQ